MNKKTTINILTFFLLGIVNPTIAAPVTDNSVINILQFDFVNPTFIENSTNSSFSNTFNSTADIQAFGNVSTGKVGTRVIGSEGNSSQSIVSVFDTLNFDTGSSNPVEIFFDLTYEGVLGASSVFNNPRSDSTVRIFDITGLDAWLETSGLFNTTSAIDAATLLTFERISFNLDGLARDGTLFDFNSSISGSF